MMPSVRSWPVWAKCLACPWLAAFVLLVCGMAWAHPASAQLKSSEPQKEVVAILPLQPLGSSEIHAAALTDRLGEELLKSGRFTLVDRSQIESILNEQALQQTGCTEQECAVEVGRILGVRRMVAGRITRIEDGLWLLSAILVDVETSQTMAAESVRHAGSYLGLLDEGIAVLANKLAVASGIETKAAPAAPAPAAVATAPPASAQAGAPAQSDVASLDNPDGGTSDGGSAVPYVGSALLAAYAVKKYNDAQELSELASSSSTSDSDERHHYEDERDKALQEAKVALLGAAGLLTWALIRDPPATARHTRAPSAQVTFVPTPKVFILAGTVRW